MNDLKRHIETIVHPLRMSHWQKMRLREELLGHLQGIYDEELAKSDDSEAAIASAIKRFGDVVELSASLQSTVPWYDAAWRMTETIPRLLLLICLAVLLLEIPSITLLCWALNVDKSLFNPELYATWGVAVAIIPACAAYVLLMSGAIYGVLNHRKSTLLAVCYTVCFAAYASFGAWLIDWPLYVIAFAYPVVWTALTFSTAIEIGRLIRDGEKERHEWESLELAA